MTTLDDAWVWYQRTRISLQLLGRLGGKYWSQLPWDGPLGRDNKFRTTEAAQVVADAALAQRPLDDLAVTMMFAAFEATVRHVIAGQIGREAVSLRHPMLVAAARDAVVSVNTRAFSTVLAAYSKGGHADLAERVRQVRRYRNWVSHGRRGRPPETIDPNTAYERLRNFLALVMPPDPEPTAASL